ncbi:Inositol-trisphosphate 3-kinase B [Frankliniella fusca]|uniref:Kinase n=1 Tax=Frankliniella fusca TaxID=407009 RepID=A0AAE1GXY8_9NEOP|nr:Inositol-trisphosphate 3-kinase B [Frankliniella fusca]
MVAPVIAKRAYVPCSRHGLANANTVRSHGGLGSRTVIGPSGWRKIRNIVTWSPFVQNYKNQQYFWVQLAGHQGNFRAGPTPGTILKKVCTAEELAFKALMKDRLKPYVPDYKGQITSEEGDSYLHLQDLLSEFNKPCVMDCKMGVRTYLEDELNKARGNQKLRKDMYEKMIAVNPDEPTEDERRAGGVTKTRYMVFRETMSSTATLGFRIEGLKKSDGQSSKDFKTTKERDQIINAFREFTRGFPHAVGRYIQRLRAIKATLEVSDFFATHEVIGSSLLFVHDADKANIWLIDFAKSRVLPPGVGPISHNAPWTEGNHEDGYLIGLRNLIDIFTEMEQTPEAPATPPSPPASPGSPSTPSSTPSSTPRSADSSPANTSPPTSPEAEAAAPVTPRAVPSLNRKDTLVAQVSEDDAQEESPPPYSVQLELRPHCLAAEAEAADAAAEDGAPSAVSSTGQPRPQQRLTSSLPLPIHIKKTDTVLALQTPAEAAALDRTELT